MKLDISKIIAKLTLLESQPEVLKQECCKAREELERVHAPTPPKGKREKNAATVAKTLMNRNVVMYKKKV